MRRFTLISFLLLSFLCGFGQSKTITISGTVRDGKNGEELIGATIAASELPGVGAATNAYGFYSLTLPSGKYTLQFKYVGYEPVKIFTDTVKATQLNVSLFPETKALKEITVSAEKGDENVKSADVSAVKLDIKQLEKVPVLFGEKDLLKTIQLLPGIQPASEGNAGFYVRGGSNDQNLILLDEATVYNASHLLGFFSTFNNDAIKDATIYKGNMPAEFGGRLSSVLDVKMKDGNSKNYVISGGIGLISSRLNVEGPIVKDKGSFFVSGRRTYADLFLKLSKNEQLRKSQLYFFDINAKANYRFGNKDRVFISGYFGQDKFMQGDRFGIDYGNATATARWNHIFSEKLFSNTSFIFNDFNYTASVAQFGIELKSLIRDYSIKEDLDFFINSNNKLKTGFQVTFHSIVPGEVTSKDTSRLNNLALPKNYGLESAVYAQHEISLFKKVNLIYGLRLSVFSQTGPGKAYTFNEFGDIDTISYKLGQFGKTYVNPEPRFSMSYNFIENMSFKLAYSRNVQNLHLLSNTTTSFPTDRWIMTSNNVKPEIADQVSAGYFVNFYKNMFELSLEGYYKHLQNQIDYVNGAQLRINETIESQLLYGIGRAYGMEFFFKKRTGKFTGMGKLHARQNREEVLSQLTTTLGTLHEMTVHTM
jgi:hypothetical protein